MEQIRHTRNEVNMANNQKKLALFLTLTIFIWGIPYIIITGYSLIITEAYNSIYKWLEVKNGKQ